HITCRAEVVVEAADLLTDFAGRPKLDAGELDRERGVVIQEIQRYKDQPSAVAEELADRAAFGDHPLGRTVLGPEEHLRTFTREGIVAF
ncbi:M16 family metallopeptidase, partial [Klebsiella pneumoniae]|uniref:M16 family metallopeptidase n=1 Tax=Klebsiella pneumoniae TaxID=573 RepID=UPI0025A1DEC6